MKRLVRISIVVVVVWSGIVGGTPTVQADDRPVGAIVGHTEPMDIRPDLGFAVTVEGGLSWNHAIEVADATFVKPHFVNVNLRAGDSIVLRSPTGKIVETIEGRGPKDMGTFWGLSAMGDAMTIEFLFNHDYPSPPFGIDRALIGDVDLFDDPPEEPESICYPADFEDVVCYDDDPGKWANVIASVGVMNAGANPTYGLWCSGSNVSSDGHVLTNDHCVTNQSECNSVEFVFRYYNQNCGSGPTTPDWQGYRCDVQVANSPYVSCEATATSLDFSLNSTIGDPSATFGFVQPDPVPLTSGEAVYIVQHPSGRPHEITHGSGVDVEVDGHNLRYYNTLDTEGGSSGSPLYREADDKLIGLHHCGGCTTPGTGNRGMMMADIYPHIEEWLCSAEVDVAAAGTRDLVEVDGNGNAVVEPGETWQFRARARNDACDLAALNVAGELAVNPTSAGPLYLLDRTASFGDIWAGGIGETPPLQFMLSPFAECGAFAVIDLVNLTADNGGPFPGSPELLSTMIGEDVLDIPHYTDFNDGTLSGWAAVDHGDPGSWTTTNPLERYAGLTAPFALADAGNAAGLMDEELVSPVVDLTFYSRATLQFDHNFAWAGDDEDTRCDVDIRSAATGGQWVNLRRWTATETSGTVSVELGDSAAGQSDVQFRFHFSSADRESFWAVDDIFVITERDLNCEIWHGSPDLVFADGFESGDVSMWSSP